MNKNTEYGQYWNKQNENTKESEQQKEYVPKDFVGRIGSLVVEEDTIYEIDEECMNCREKGKQ